MSSPDDAPPPRRTARLRQLAGSAARTVNDHATVVAAARYLRERLPGDSRYGDPLSTAGSTPTQSVLRRLSEATAERPGVLREVGLGALQVWQAASEAQGRGRGDHELTIAFTDLERFSTYALEAGDDAAVDLLRAAGEAIEPAIRDGGGEVVKRLGDGVMAVFRDPAAALESVCVASSAVEAIDAGGYRPRMRAGLHVGRPRRLAGDYFGVDVNIAARLADEAAGGEILVSDSVLANVDAGRYRTKRKRWFRVRGVPRDVSAYRVQPA